ncbi:MAG: sulfur carrier protein ThiS [Gammaproteobacteria bacterium]|jgi:sulfur carrier protein|nr:sulfur carrier protein ThiS [Gammaproteobacteria bacterium]MDP6535931.1 sulfur carrier protein ThiS [Gammaproteobacteria bacterium]MDP6733423.1 sulfur carrier protein ThiS [Gammaproteobacteria bacterium]HAJ77380.1 thiamine biosynthesis protein ThiS [Gammaproteobacteria bacterium]|tara:strand:- start:193 stop:393 length:201 start_codon:yes stop_codon:yes gene_type:complete
MYVTINGNQTELDDDSSLQQLLQHLKIGEGRIAIELNGEIIPRSQFQQQLLSKGDRVEIVQAIGGG